MKEKTKKVEVDDNSELFKLFGINQESLEKSKNIKPTLTLGKKFPYNTPIELEFLEDAPHTIDTPNSNFKETGNVISVLELIGKLEYGLFLSSKTLALGVAKIYDKYKSLKGKQVRITKTTAKYKDFGENDCYIVQEIVKP